jgi:hypothetical protein
MICSGCGGEIPPGRKYLVIRNIFSGVQIEVGCDHFQPDTENATAIFGGANCALAWFIDWEESLQRCNHQPN